MNAFEKDSGHLRYDIEKLHVGIVVLLATYSRVSATFKNLSLSNRWWILLQGKLPLALLKFHLLKQVLFCKSLLWSF